MIVTNQDIEDINEKLKMILPVLNGNRDTFIKAVDIGGYSNSYNPSAAAIHTVGYPEYGEVINKIQTHFPVFYTGCTTDTATYNMLYSVTLPTKYQHTIPARWRDNELYCFLIATSEDSSYNSTNNIIIASVNTALHNYNNPFRWGDRTIPLSDGTPVFRSDYGEDLRNIYSTVVNRQMIGWVPAISMSTIPLATKLTPNESYRNNFITGFQTWVDENLSSWRIGGLDVYYKFKVDKGRYVIQSEESWKAKLVSIRSVPVYGSDYALERYAAKKAPVIYKSGTSKVATFTAGSVVEESAWLKDAKWSYTSTPNVLQDIWRDDYVIRSFESAVDSCSFDDGTGSCMISQETKLCNKSMTYTPCLNYPISGLSSANSFMYFSRNCWIPASMDWPDYPSDIWIRYDSHGPPPYWADNPSHTFDEINNSTLTDRMTDTMDVYQKTVSHKLVNPYNYKIQVRIRIQKIFGKYDAGGEEEVFDDGPVRFWTNYVLGSRFRHVASPADLSTNKAPDFEAGITLTWHDPEVETTEETVYLESGGNRTVERDHIVVPGPEKTDTNGLINTPSAQGCIHYYDNSNYGMTKPVCRHGWDTFEDIFLNESIKGACIDLFYNDIYTTDSIDITLEPGESYIIEKPPAPVWEGSSQILEDTLATIPWEGEPSPGSLRRQLNPTKYNTTDYYRVTYCWKPVTEEEEEEESSEDSPT